VVAVSFDGIPLAIELAAARVGSMGVDLIASRLSDRFRLLTGGSATLPRHQTLRATLDWSYGLLRGQERIVLERLSVFVGGWSLDAAEAVGACGEVSQDDVLGLLHDLVEQSMVVADDHDGTVRYRMLETVREYATQRLNADVGGALASIRQRHAGFFLDLAEEAEPGLRGPRQAAWLDRLEMEHGNLRAALTWSRTDDGDPDVGLRLAGALTMFWYTRGHFSEGSQWLEWALAAASAASTPTRATALCGAGMLACARGDYAAATKHLTDALADCQARDDVWGIAWALENLGTVARYQGSQQAIGLFEEGLTLFRSLGDDWAVAWTLGDLGRAMLRQGDHAHAVDLLTESLTLRQKLEDTRGIALASHYLAPAELARDNYDLARRRAEEARRLWTEVGDRSGVQLSLDLLADIAMQHGEAQKAASLRAASRRLRGELEHTWATPRARPLMAGEFIRVVDPPALDEPPPSEPSAPVPPEAAAPAPEAAEPPEPGTPPARRWWRFWDRSRR
jgi:non-specific serine/threonine protein kinase